jgi:DNA-binding NtrC family response regulator
LGKGVTSISNAAMERLKSYDWPGNVRELENAIERAVNLTSGPELEASHILLPETAARIGNRSDFKRAVAEAEREALLDALHRGGSIRKAAKILGVSHTTVINKIKRHGLSGNPTIPW